MVIIVEGHEIETKEITQIKEAGHREHGFVIHLIGGKKVNITERENYDAYHSELARINDRYRKLREKVEEYWNKDKTEYIVLNL